MDNNATQGSAPWSIIDDILSAGLRFGCTKTESRLIDVQKKMGAFVDIILPMRLKEIKFARCVVDRGEDKLVLRPAGNSVWLPLACVIKWEIDLPSGAVFSFETADVSCLSGENPQEWRGRLHCELFGIRGTIKARPVGIRPSLPLEHCRFEDRCSFRFKIESNIFLMLDGSSPNMQSLAWFNPKARSPVEHKRLSEIISPSGNNTEVGHYLFMCGSSYEKSLLLFVAFWQCAESLRDSISLHPVIESSFPGLRREARKLATKFDYFPDMLAIQSARKYLESESLDAETENEILIP